MQKSNSCSILRDINKHKHIWHWYIYATSSICIPNTSIIDILVIYIYIWVLCKLIDKGRSRKLFRKFFFSRFRSKLGQKRKLWVSHFRENWKFSKIIQSLFVSAKLLPLLKISAKLDREGVRTQKLPKKGHFMDAESVH